MVIHREFIWAWMYICVDMVTVGIVGGSIRGVLCSAPLLFTILPTSNCILNSHFQYCLFVQRVSFNFLPSIVRQQTNWRNILEQPFTPLVKYYAIDYGLSTGNWTFAEIYFSSVCVSQLIENFLRLVNALKS